MRPAVVLVIVGSLLGAALCGWATVNEYNYYLDHPERTGVSGVLTVLSLGTTLGCLSVALLAWTLGRDGGENS